MSTVNSIAKEKNLTKPLLGSSGAKKLASAACGVANLVTVEQLDSYYDLNFKLSSRCPSSSSSTSEEEEYVMKVTNAEESRDGTLLGAQTEVLLFLSERGFNCPEPVKLPNGKYMTLVKITSEKGTFEHMIRLLRYIPGQMYKEAEMTPDLCYEAGRYLGRMDMALKDFNHEGLHRPAFLWNMWNVPSLSDLIYVFEEEKKRQIIRSVVDDFKEHVEPNYDKLRKGAIHGDFSDTNVLILPRKPNGNANLDSTEYEVSGLVDFGCLMIGPPVFEIATAMAYTMMHSDRPVEIGGHVLAGYLSAFPLSALERSLLFYCVAGRIAQSVTIGMYSSILHPENAYHLDTQEPGWRVLHVLKSAPKEAVAQAWERIVRGRNCCHYYQTRDLAM